MIIIGRTTEPYVVHYQAKDLDWPICGRIMPFYDSTATQRLVTCPVCLEKLKALPQQQPT